MKSTGNTVYASSSLSSITQTLIIQTASSFIVKLPWLEKTGCYATSDVLVYLNTSLQALMKKKIIHPTESQVIDIQGQTAKMTDGQ